MIKILKENHLAVFDCKKQYITAFTFQIVMPQSKKNQSQAKPELSEEYSITLHIMEKFQYTWESQFFDLEAAKNQNTEFGNIPFSLDTFLQLYKDPRIWDIVLRPKLDDLELQDVVDKVAGKLIIKTNFTQNPFILPVQSRKINMQSLKTIKVITAASVWKQVICSGDLVDKVTVQQVDIWAGLPNNELDKIEQEDEVTGFDIYTFEAGERINAQNICIIAGQFFEQTSVHRGRTVKILSQGKQVSFISNLQKTMKILKFIDNDIFIFQNVNTNIEDSYRIVFFTDALSIYSRIFRSFLYSKIYDRWVIEGMVHYNRDNRHFQDLMTELVELMTEGQELFPLCNHDYDFDQVWKVKAKFIYHILVNVSGSNLNDWILDFARKRKLTSPMILKKIKDNFGKDKIKTIYEQQFITSTGMTRIFYDIENRKKDPKIRLTLRQKSLQCNLFRKYNYYRIKLEESYRCVSPLMERIIKKNQGKRSEMSGPLAVPKFLKCIPYFVGPLSIQIENMEPIEENLQQQNITEKYLDFKASNRSRRPTSKKQSQLSDNDAWMMLDAGLVFPAVYKNQKISEKLIPNLIKRIYQSEIEELKVLNSISIRKHSNSINICRELIEKLKIKPGKENSKISVKRKILQLLPNFMQNCRDTTIWDQLLKLLQLYEPVCFDYSEQGNLFLHSILQSIGNINYNVSYSSYFEEFHRVMLAISRFHQCITQDKFQAIHRQLFKSMMRWVSKYSFQILQQACDYLELTLTQPRRCLTLIKIIVENVLPYIDTMRLKKQDYKVVRDINNRIDEHVQTDKTGTIRAVKFHYQTKQAEINYKPLDFLTRTFTQLENIRDNHLNSYDKCLEKFKNIISKNRQRYAMELQLSILNENQNYFLAQYIWNQMCQPLSLVNERVRLGWIKIYRVFYFYFTPIITMVKLGKNISTREFDMDENQTIQILNNIMDFVPDIKWFSVYDSSSNKQGKTDQNDQGRRKKKENQDYKIEFNSTNIFTEFIEAHPGKDSWEDLTKVTLLYLQNEYENKESGYVDNENQKIQIDSTTEGKYKKIVDKLKLFINLLKRGNTPDNLDFPKLKKKVVKLLNDSGESLDKCNELFELQEKTLEMISEQREKKENEKNDGLKISFGSLVKQAERQ